MSNEPKEQSNLLFGEHLFELNQVGLLKLLTILAYQQLHCRKA